MKVSIKYILTDNKHHPWGALLIVDGEEVGEWGAGPTKAHAKEELFAGLRHDRDRGNRAAEYLEALGEVEDGTAKG